MLKEKILDYASKLTRQAVYNMDIVDGNIVRNTGRQGAHEPVRAGHARPV